MLIIWALICSRNKKGTQVTGVTERKVNIYETGKDITEYPVGD